MSELMRAWTIRLASSFHCIDLRPRRQERKPHGLWHARTVSKILFKLGANWRLPNGSIAHRNNLLLRRKVFAFGQYE